MVEEHKQTTIPIPEKVDQNTSNVQILADNSANDGSETQTKNVVDNVVAKEMVEEEEEEVTSELKTCTTENGAEMGSEDDDKFSELEMKAMEELKKLIQNALNTHQFTNPPLLQEQVDQEAPIQAEGEANADHKSIEEETNEESEEPTAKVTVNEDGTKTVEAIVETIIVHTGADKLQNSSAASASSSLAVTSQQETDTTTPSHEEEVSIWGVPLLKDERTDTILWKFLRARDFQVNEAFKMIKSTIKWRKEFKIDELMEEDLGEDLEKVVFMHGYSKEGNPICYNVFGGFQDKELYKKTFFNEEKREKFLKWRIQFLEKSIRKLNFFHGGISTIVQVNDLKNSPGPGKWELRQATKQALHLLQDNYPEFVAKQVFINVPWWYVAVNKMIRPFLTQRTTSKFVVAAPSKSAQTLFRYIAPEQVPIQYGGLSKGEEFDTKDGATQIIMKPPSKETIEFAFTEACNVTWEVRVLGWDVNYGAEFVPNASDAYTIIIQKMKKVGPTQQSVITNTFNIGEPGKVVLTIHNLSSKKKILLYRLKYKPINK